MRALIRAALAALMIVATPAHAADSDAVARGRLVFDAAGCKGCHTVKDGPALAGGRRLKTPFGVFVSPNITPDKETGIGAWSAEDFRRALRDGISPDGRLYFPVFPYPSFTRMTDADIDDLAAYVFSLAPVARRNLSHELRPPLTWRFTLYPWRWLYFTPGAFKPDPARDPVWNRGAYLVQALGHCGECHTPRNALGAPKVEMTLAGTVAGPEGGSVPNITPDPDTGIGRWSDGELTSVLKDGMLPDGDFVGAGMAEVIENSTGRLGESDLSAIIAYLRSVAPVTNKISRK